MFIELQCPDCGKSHTFNLEVDVEVSTKRQKEKFVTDAHVTNVEVKDDYAVGARTIEIYFGGLFQFGHKQEKEIRAEIHKMLSKHGIEEDVLFIE
jgi:hypothetical protein